MKRAGKSKASKRRAVERRLLAALDRLLKHDPGAGEALLTIIGLARSENRRLMRGIEVVARLVASLGGRAPRSAP